MSHEPSRTRVEVVASIEHARELRAPWSDLAERALDREPFLTPEWLLAWWEAFGAGTMKLVLIWADGRLIGVGPFAVENQRIWGRSRRVLRFWSNSYSNRTNVVLDRDRAPGAAAALVDYLFDGPRDWDVARFGPVLADGRATEAFMGALLATGRKAGVRGAHASPYLALPNSWDALEARLGGSYRRSLRRKARKAEAAGGVEVTLEGRSVEDVEDAFRIDRNAWQHRAGTGIGSQPEIEQFYRALAEHASERGWLRMAYLSAGGTPVCYELNLEYHGVLYNLKLGYDAEHADLSPGLVLKRKVLEQAIRDGLKEYDFLGEEEPYKMRWADGVRTLGTIHFHRSGVAPSLAHSLYFNIRPLVERRFPWALKLKRRLWPVGD